MYIYVTSASNERNIPLDFALVKSGFIDRKLAVQVHISMDWMKVTSNQTFHNCQKCVYIFSSYVYTFSVLSYPQKLNIQECSLHSR